MAVKVVMPKLGMAMKKGEVSVWNKKVGDPVEKGESIASINSEKIEMEIEAPESGTLLHIKVKEGEGVPRERPSVISGKTAKKCGRRRRRLLKMQGNRNLNLNIFPLPKPGKSVNTA